ncbi:FtsX-like permease family protein [Paenibacillus oenotherae]|uniref:FtsX-like permease family protein n=1 Tax=Paenibacillus oenotherae TaxID=1435645 RepID=A0ABS7DA65_9BACL|nr:FtsX-like permease family protein [Paenibacillus oenotherae]MBW7476776.1 FtsX-like permease family protein [Paenibacillus oenotherae]
MKFNDKLKFVKQNMNKNKSRIFMTVLATAMGCSFLIMIASVAFGLQQSLINDLLQDRSITEIQVHALKKGESYENLQQSDLDALKNVEHVKAMSVQRIAQGETSIGDYVSMNGTRAVVSNFEQEMKAGLELSEGRAPANDQETVVGYHFAKNLAKRDANNEILENEIYNGNVLGATITFKAKGFDPETNAEVSLGEFSLTIVGILEKPDREWTENSTIYLSDRYNEILFPGDSLPPPSVKLIVDHAENVTDVSSELRSNNYSVYSVADSIKEMDLVFLVMKIGLLFVGTIAVLIASIGIYNTMTMAVTERAQDIGIMKAIGANPRTIRSIFLLESFGIGLLGVLIGTIVSYALSALINAAVPPILSSVLDGNPPDDFMFSSIPITLTLVSAGISLGVAVLSGMRPAARATRIDVLRALRRDI